MSKISFMTNINPNQLKPALADYVLGYAKSCPDRIALSSEYGDITYVELGLRVRRLALALQRSGVNRGDRVAVLTTPRSDAYTVFLALNAIGAIWLGINPVYQYSEMLYVVDDASPVALVFLEEFQGRSYGEDAARLLHDSSSLQNIYCLEQELEGVGSLESMVTRLVGEGESLSSDSQRDREDVAMIVYTSGSTGNPKGCMLPNKAMAYRAFTQWQQFQLSDYPRVFCPLPLNHVGGMQMVAGAALFAGGTVNFREKFNAAEVGQVVSQGKINFMVMFPTMYQLICDDLGFREEDFATLECINFSGGVISRELLGKLATLGSGRVCTCFGSTETCIGVVFSEPGLDLDILSISVGRPIRNDVRVVNTDGEPCQTGEIGEFQVIPDYCMVGYFNRPEATAAAFTEDGWLKSGDLVEVLPDGNFRFSARVSDMFKSGGYNVYPREVEIALEEHEAISAAAVVGVPDPLYGEVGYAYLTLLAQGTIDTEQLIQWCKVRVSNYKIPKTIEVLEAMPLLPNGKLDKTSLKKMAMQI
ncbi:MAG: class I adenylate-forming enzyme family protein [Halioglobus sp.]